MFYTHTNTHTRPQCKLQGALRAFNRRRAWFFEEGVGGRLGKVEF